MIFMIALRSLHFNHKEHNKTAFYKNQPTKCLVALQRFNERVRLIAVW